MAYNIFAFEKRNIVYGVFTRSILEDIPNIILQIATILASNKLTSCKNNVDNSYLQKSIIISLSTLALSILMFVSDFINREKNFLQIL